ncbi:adhesive plaque matrix protein-like [Homarus americanus]|uniref:adhesive plaque matrix protein-like n=1 Tax=Homarus americanus TaxID=6706 RepID=UPI001C468FE7|nr:adhesive plaque matrix protein-like [Homarus americanus]
MLLLNKIVVAVVVLWVAGYGAEGTETTEEEEDGDLETSETQDGEREARETLGYDPYEFEAHDIPLLNQKHVSYDFAYSVRDDDTGASYSHAEEREGKTTRGEYRVSLPDGRVQVVSYIADENGYRAKVSYEPLHAVHPLHVQEALKYAPEINPTTPRHPRPPPGYSARRPPRPRARRLRPRPTTPFPSTLGHPDAPPHHHSIPKDVPYHPIPTQGSDLPIPTRGSYLPIPTQGSYLPIPTDVPHHPISTQTSYLPLPKETPLHPVPVGPLLHTIPTESSSYLPKPTESSSYLPIPTESPSYLPKPTVSSSYLPIPTKDPYHPPKPTKSTYYSPLPHKTTNYPTSKSYLPTPFSSSPQQDSTRITTYKPRYPTTQVPHVTTEPLFYPSDPTPATHGSKLGSTSPITASTPTVTPLAYKTLKTLAPLKLPEVTSYKPKTTTPAVTTYSPKTLKDKSTSYKPASIFPSTLAPITPSPRKSTSYSSPGPYSPTPYPSSGSYSPSPYPSPVPYTPSPNPGPYSTPSSYPGPYSTPSPYPGPYSTPSPYPGPYSTLTYHVLTNPSPYSASHSPAPPPYSAPYGPSPGSTALWGSFTPNVRVLPALLFWPPVRPPAFRAPHTPLESRDCPSTPETSHRPFFSHHCRVSPVK